MPLLQIKNLTKLYSLRSGDTDNGIALNEVNLKVSLNEKLAIVGQTGSGKSTLLKIAAGLLPMDSGEVFFDGEKLQNPEEQLIPGHPDIAYLSQHFELPKYVTVERHLFDPYEMTGDEALKVYHACQIDHLLDADTSQLSGGEKQRVALAKLILSWPSLLLLDEPFSNLDPIHKQTIKDVITSVSEDLAITVVLVSHDPTDVLSWADTIVVLKAGEVVQQGTPEMLYQKPKNEYVAGLFGTYNLIYPEEWNLKPNGHLKIRDGRILLRPEAFKLSKNGGQGVDGEVVNVLYYGGYQEVRVMTSKNTLTLRTKVGEYEKNRAVKVYLTVQEEG